MLVEQVIRETKAAVPWRGKNINKREKGESHTQHSKAQARTDCNKRIPGDPESP